MFSFGNLCLGKVRLANTPYHIYKKAYLPGKKNGHLTTEIIDSKSILFKNGLFFYLYLAVGHLITSVGIYY